MMKIADLEIRDDLKRVLTFLGEVKSIAQVAGEMNVTYNCASQYLRVWAAKDWVKRIKRLDGRIAGYKINLKELEL